LFLNWCGGTWPLSQQLTFISRQNKLFEFPLKSHASPNLKMKTDESRRQKRQVQGQSRL
jgi:hypothetical protein